MFIAREVCLLCTLSFSIPLGATYSSLLALISPFLHLSSSLFVPFLHLFSSLLVPFLFFSPSLPYAIFFPLFSLPYSLARQKFFSYMQCFFAWKLLLCPLLISPLPFLPCMHVRMQRGGQNLLLSFSCLFPFLFIFPFSIPSLLLNHSLNLFVSFSLYLPVFPSLFSFSHNKSEFHWAQTMPFSHLFSSLLNFFLTNSALLSCTRQSRERKKENSFVHDAFCPLSLALLHEHMCVCKGEMMSEN